MKTPKDILTAEQIEQLRAIGWHVVPLDPDLPMKQASIDALKYYDEVANVFASAGWLSVWPQMIKAAPDPLASDRLAVDAPADS